MAKTPDDSGWNSFRASLDMLILGALQWGLRALRVDVLNALRSD